MLYGVICERHRGVFHPTETEEQGGQMKLLGKMAIMSPAKK
jgi:hypothetical protein